MHVETWKKNITEGGEVTLEMTRDYRGDLYDNNSGNRIPDLPVL